MIRGAVLAVLTAGAWDDEHSKQIESYKSCGYVGVPVALLQLEDGARVSPLPVQMRRSRPMHARHRLFCRHPGAQLVPTG